MEDESIKDVNTGVKERNEKNFVRRINKAWYCWQLRCDKNWERIVINVLLEALIVGVFYVIYHFRWQMYAKAGVCGSLSGAAARVLKIFTNIFGNIEPSLIFDQQLSLSFIILTLTALLSTNLKTIYWTNQMEFKLKRPVVFGFVGYTTRIVTSFVVTCIFINSKFVYINFLIFFVTIVTFMYKLIFVNYDGKETEKKIREYFDWVNEASQSTDNARGWEKKRDDLLENIENDFVLETCRYAENSDLNGFDKNIRFLLEHGKHEQVIRIMTITTEKSLTYMSTFLEIVKGQDYERNGNQCRYDLKNSAGYGKLTKIMQDKKAKNLNDTSAVRLENECVKILGENK